MKFEAKKVVSPNSQEYLKGKATEFSMNLLKPLLRETMSSLTSDMGKETVSVLAHYFLMRQRTNYGYILSIYHLRYSGT